VDRVDFTAAWQDIASAPRDGQWFYAFGKSGVIYHACWCPDRQCFVHTKTNQRVNPTYWRWVIDETQEKGFARARRSRASLRRDQ